MIVSLSSKWALDAESSFIKWEHFFKIAFYIAEIKLV